MINNSPKREISIIKINSHIHSFENVSFQSGIESINLSNNLIHDFEGFQPLEKLKTLIMDGNPIISFQGFPVDWTSNIEEVSFVNCPISKLGSFRSLCLIALGYKLKKINGINVTRNDQSYALKYGDPKTVRLLVISGWIPQRPVALQQDTVNSIWESLENHKKDPFSLKAVSLLRTIGYDKEEIKNFIRLHFSPDSNFNRQSKKNNSSLLDKDQQTDSIENKLQKQQELINVLSVQLQALRNGNKSFNAYDDMIKTIGAPLIENARIINVMALKREGADSNLESNKSNEAEDYEELRKAAIDLIQEDETIDDYELIQKLSELIQDDEEDNDQIDQVDSDKLKDNNSEI